MSRVCVAAGLVALAAACTEPEVGTSPYAHESPPPPPPLTDRLARVRFLGGSGVDRIDDVVVRDGTIYVVGGTSSPDFPTTDGSTLDAGAPAGCSACPFAGFVAALDLDGNILWSRLIDSPGYDRLTAVAIGAGSLYVAGTSGERPGLAGWRGGASAERGAQDGLVCALDPTDGAVEACRYVGGTGPGGVSDLVLDLSDGAPIVALTTVAGEDLHLDPAYAAAFAGRHRATAAGADGVVLRLATDLAAADSLRWATYVGGSGDEDGTPSVAVDGDRIYYLGATTSTDVPVPGGWRTTAPAGANAFLAALSADGRTLSYGTYVGGDGDDLVGANGLTSWGGGVTVGITTTSTDLPLSFSWQPSYGGDGGSGCGSGDVWLAEIDPIQSGAASLGSRTYLGGAAGDHLGGLAWTQTLGGVAVVATGHTQSFDFPIRDAAQGALEGSCTSTPGTADAFATVGDPGRSLQGSTYLGGSGLDRGTAVASLPYGDGLVVVGDTASPAFPAQNPGGGTLGGPDDGFVAIFRPYTPGGGGGGDGGGADAGPVAGDADEPPGGCCGASAPPASGLGLATLVLGLLVRRRPRPR